MMIFHIRILNINIKIIYQQYFRFFKILSVRENIAISNLNMINNDSKIQQALEYMELSNFKLDGVWVNLLMELIYQQGNGKKISNIKSIFRDSEILILGLNLTASLDPKIEYKIYQDFLNISENKIIIYVL